jgi:hypothetical protein
MYLVYVRSIRERLHKPDHPLDLILKMYLSKLTSIVFLAATAVAHLVVPNDDQDMSGVVVNGIPYSTRVKYMRLVYLPTPGPFWYYN